MPVLPPFNQAAIDACARLALSNAADILAALNATSFYTWYNAQFKGVPEVADRCPIKDTPENHKAFVTFWDQIGTIFGRGSISGLEFCALMGINLQEASGKLSGMTEGVNRMSSPHPGLAYAFDAIPGLKVSYNNGGANRTARDLFGDPLFKKAHGNKSGAAAILNRAGGIDPKWGGDTWPAGVPADPDASRNGFVMEADFYKFRGRGVIQTTWRSTYQDVIKWIRSGGATANPAIVQIAAQWDQAVADIPAEDQKVAAIATLSSNADWNTIFQQPITLAKGIAIFSASKADFLNSLKRDAATLDHPDRKIKGSFRFFASRINGGDYPEHVAPKMKALVRGVAQAQFQKPQPAGVPIS